jgi:hypothetical protein
MFNSCSKVSFEFIGNNKLFGLVEKAKVLLISISFSIKIQMTVTIRAQQSRQPCQCLGRGGTSHMFCVDFD